MWYYCQKSNIDYAYIKISDFNTPLTMANLQSLSKSKGIISLNFSNPQEHARHIAYFSNFYSIKKHIKISHLASIIYLDTF